MKGWFKDDVKVKRGSNGKWITLKEARLERMGPKTADAAAKAMPPPPAKPSAPAAGNGSNLDLYPNFKPSACYTEDIDDRIRRMIREGKFDAQIKALRAGLDEDKLDGGVSMAALRGVAEDGPKDAAVTDKQGGGKRGRDEGKAGEDGDQGKKARTAGKFPVKEPKVPVEIPTERQDVVDPRVRSEPPKSKGGKKAKHTDDEKPTLDLPLPIFAEEKEAGEAAREGKTGKTKDDGYQSDDSWDKKPGILEDPEEIEREKRKKELERAWKMVQEKFKRNFRVNGEIRETIM